MGTLLIILLGLLMAKLTLNTIGSRYGSIDALNDNSDLVEAAFENTLSRDGTGPNNMESDLDMDSYSLLNVSNINGFNVTSLGPDINTVANNITSVVTTATNIVDVNTVADNLNTTDTIGTVAPSIANVNLVGTDIVNVNTVSTNIADVNTVANNLNTTNTISTVAASINNVNAVSNNIVSLTTVSDNIGNVAIVGSDLSNEYIYIEDNGSILDPVTATIGVSNIKTVADDITDVSIVANIASSVTAVANNNVDVSTVALDINNVSIVAQNIADVNSFANTYFIGATEPTGPTIGEGDLWYDTVNKVIKTYNGTIWAAAFVSLSGALLAVNNLNDVPNKTQAVTNLFSDNFTIDLGVLV